MGVAVLRKHKMGTELQTKYQKLAHEYARVRAQVDVLKKGVITEKTQRTQLEEELRLKEQSLRKHSQENESLGFRNQQLSKRVQMLQSEMESSLGRSKKKNKDMPSPSTISKDVQTEELAAKITENERLHTRVFEISKKSEKLIGQLKEKIAKLEQEVTNNDVLVNELNKDHSTKIETVREERIMLQAKLEKVLDELTKSRDMNVYFSDENKGSLPLQPVDTGHTLSLLNDKDGSEYGSYNVTGIDRSVSSKLDLALSAAVQMVERFFANLSTVFMYLEQRCLSYPIDTSNGLQPSPVNQKLCNMLQSLSLYTDQLLGILLKHTNSQDLSLSTSSELLPNIHFALKNFAIYFETSVAYIQLSVECESLESVCGSQLTDINSHFSQSFKMISGIVTTISKYVIILDEGKTDSSSQAFILDRIQSSSVDLHNAFIGLTSTLNSKVTMEYQLPTASSKLQTTNECTVSAVTSLSSASEEIVEYFKAHNKTLLMSLNQTSKTSGANKKNQNLSVTAKLRQHAVSYYDRLIKSPCDQVPYNLAVHLSKQFVGNTEKGEALEKQVQILKTSLSKAEEGKTQLEIDYQKLSLYCEKISAQLNAGGNIVNRSPKSPSSPHTTSLTPTVSDRLLGTLTSQDLLVEADEDVSTEMLIRQHSSARLAELNTQLHEAESKAAFLQSQCIAMTKLLEHTNGTRKDLINSLATAEQSIQQLQDEISTLSSGYDSQLSTMSDHLCELRDDLLKKQEELELFKRNSGGRKKWNK